MQPLAHGSRLAIGSDFGGAPIESTGSARDDAQDLLLSARHLDAKSVLA